MVCGYDEEMDQVRCKSSRNLSRLGTTRMYALDWKQSLSPKKDRLTQHLSAFANYPNGGIIVFGVDDQTATLKGVQQPEVASIIGQLANLGCDALEPPVRLDHAIVDIAGAPILFVLVKERSH